MLLYRFDAPLFFANAGLFRADLLQRIDESPTTVRWVTVLGTKALSAEGLWSLFGLTKNRHR